MTIYEVIKNQSGEMADWMDFIRESNEEELSNIRSLFGEMYTTQFDVPEDAIKSNIAFLSILDIVNEMTILDTDCKLDPDDLYPHFEILSDSFNQLYRELVDVEYAY